MFRLGDEALADYRDRGFGHLDRLIDDDQVAELREAYDRVMAADPDRGALLGGVTRQLMLPSTFDPTFRQNAALDHAYEVARSILGTEDVAQNFDMLIHKPAGHPHETPWHQDISYVQVPFAPKGFPTLGLTIQFWVAIDDADEENGCMHFVPGRHREGGLEHRVASGLPTDSNRLLEIVDPEVHLDLGAMVAVPLAAGGCTFHGEGTPHATPPNRSVDRPRRAYIFNVAASEVVAATRER